MLAPAPTVPAVKQHEAKQSLLTTLLSHLAGTIDARERSFVQDEHGVIAGRAATQHDRC
ncbi:hypothetical protein NOVOSPHI9U_150027 [Novosphingobium sp. 9U]|nr:hypothetical protein NOVOSPHI9U_150027 [Novosphingobium sp. 9U]